MIGTYIKIVLLASFISTLAISTAAAQTPVYENSDFQYFNCSQLSSNMSEATVDYHYTMIMRLVGTYNEQTSGVSMSSPERSLCFVSFGKSGSLVAGTITVNFYVSENHFRCSVNGSCIGDLEGYQAGVTLMRAGVQYVVNTREYSDAVAFCSRNSGENSFGYCSR